MAANSTLFSRLTLSRNDANPVLPFYASRRSLKHKPSEYDLDELEPRAEESLLPSSDTEPAFFPEPLSHAQSVPFRNSRPSPSVSPNRNDYDYKQSMPPPSPPSTRMQSRVLFAGPPPPIATSMLMYRDVEDRAGSVIQLPPDHQPGGHLGASIRLPTSSVLFNQSMGPQAGGATLYDGDSTWINLQRRERALQKDIQNFLDIQSAGLSAGLGRQPLHPRASSGLVSDSGHSRSRSRSSNTPTADSTYTTSARSSRLPTDRATASGAVIPVRQPRPRKLGLRAARAGLSRSIARLGDLKAEEDASLVVALNTRKRALVQLRKLAGRRDSIAGELQSLETDGEEPLTRELRTLESAHTSTSQQITELERQLAMLRSRKRTLEKRITDVRSQRDAGLSGYQGALKEVESQLAAVLRRPPVQPLDVETMGGLPGRSAGGAPGEDSEAPESSPGGAEFMRLRPERRTADMARLWWENEVSILERRRREVQVEQAALEDGAGVWMEAVRLVSDFEADLRKQITAGDSSSADDDSIGKGKSRELTPEERMHVQLGKMESVIAGLTQHLGTAEDKGWNLLICAIGAELEAFQEAHRLLQESLRAAGFDLGDTDDNRHEHDGLEDSLGDAWGRDDNDDDTPRLAGSLAATIAFKPATDTLVDTSVAGGNDDHGASESDDNDVPPELLVTHGDDDGDDGSHAHNGDGHLDQDDSSENEVPLEFLSEHQAIGEP